MGLSDELRDIAFVRFNSGGLLPEDCHQLVLAAERLDACERFLAGRPWVTYRRGDGDEIYGEYQWMTTDDWATESDEPIEVVEETWVLVKTRTYMVNSPSEEDDETDS